MRSQTSSLFTALTCGLAITAIAPARASVVALNGIAAGDTAYYEYFSDAFFRMDLVEPPPNDRQQRFHLISNPAVVIGNPAFDGFPNDEDFRIGSVTFDESVLVGGSGTAPITAMTLGIGAQPGNPAYINYGRWTDITTTVNQFVGTVDVVNNVPVAMDLTSTVTVTAAGGAISATGTFDVTGDQYAGLITVPGAVAWEFSGTLTSVPEPAGLALFAASCAVILRRRSL
ncbi:MAG: PEP-CTERM sorting domain-containing protein [Phycisphaerales bacterium]|nr:PEP-CTERM sorting domain-containing protein [Phycisphaerales bacterium]